MAIEYFDWGGTGETDLCLFAEQVQRLYNACETSSSCEVLELRIDGERESQSIIVQLGDGTFDVGNPVGIQRKERLALTYVPGAEFCWEVRPLRKDFPVTIHQNHVASGEPRSLCLYLEPWESVERSWTPELFLKRILWWLRSTADDTIHGDDQPIEQLFFTSPYQIVLPEGHFDADSNLSKKLFFHCIDPLGVKQKTLVATYEEQGRDENTPFCISVSLLLEPVENGPVEAYPHTLGELQDMLSARSSDVVSQLREALDDLMPAEGLASQIDEKEYALLLLGIPRSRNGEVEKVDVIGFSVDSSVGDLGLALSVYLAAPGGNRLFRAVNIGGSQPEQSGDWRHLKIMPLEAKCYPDSSQIRRMSGLEPDSEGPKGIIAGVGALGSAVAEIWNKECWGHWVYVDDDVIQPHNVLRHICNRDSVGFPKSYAVDVMTGGVHSIEREGPPRHFVSSILSEGSGVLAAIEESELLIDVTTTLHVPRALSKRDGVPRTVSAFITPSGGSAVMLLEDKERNIRCGSLEAQYYRAILETDWGAEHLEGHGSQLWVGAGCRQVTLALSNELIRLYAAILSRQVRKAAANDSAKIAVWNHQDESGGVSPFEIQVHPSHRVEIGGWEVHWDDGFLRDPIAYRDSALPNETGGILFGIIDQKDRTITLVQACSAPSNSEATPVSFSRAAYESTDLLDECHRRTAGVGTYVGEWHSHPKGCSALPSQDDIGQLVYLSESLQIEGMPALMMIVAENAVGFYLGGERVVHN
ncbi:Uncharacterised protein [Halioglobus japonicus]|nr:Uncharacterised protein [Halioglobus japonicus]